MTIIFDNYPRYDAEQEKEDKKFLLSEYGEEKGWEKIEDIPDEFYWDYCNLNDEIEWNEVKSLFDNYFNFKNSSFFLTGTMGLWDGRHRGGFTFKDFYGMCRAFQDCDYIKIYDDKGHLYVNCSHHDGVNSFEIKELTEKGKAYLDNNDWKGLGAIADKLWESRYSKLPRFADFTWGKQFC